MTVEKVRIDVIETAKINRMQEEMRRAEAHAYRRGLCLVQISARKYSVVKVRVYNMGTDGHQSFIMANLFIGAEFGPASHSECMDYLRAAANKELTTKESADIPGEIGPHSE